MRQYFNWKTYLILTALCIVGATLFYTSQLARKLAIEEKKNVQLFVEGMTVASSSSNTEAELAFAIISRNTTIPVIIVNTEGDIEDHRNVDTSGTRNVPALLKKRLAEYKHLHEGFTIIIPDGRKSYVYYGESYLLSQLRYFPYVQLGIILLFLAVVLIALSSAHRSIQNQVWVGLSKETAHQLGTPLSSIEGWLELLDDREENKDAVGEMKKDLDRLKLVADRFSKVGSAPQLEEENLMHRLKDMVQYMQRRAPGKVSISLKTNDEEVLVNLSGPLFDWVIENLMRNALDAMDGQGSIEVRVMNQAHQVWVDVCDSGKGIPKHQLKKVFNPGFTTKKRGWGLGLSLSKRIVEQYHHGSLFVKSSEVGKGTIFRIILRR